MNKTLTSWIVFFGGGLMGWAIRDDQAFMFCCGALMPKAPHLDAGRFVVKAGASEDTRHSFNQAKFTPKGVNWIAGEWARYSLRGKQSN